MEVTDKTKADIKDSTLIDYNGQIRLLEIAQVPDEQTDLKATKRIMDEETLGLEIVINHKTTDHGEKAIQLETAVGSGNKHFKQAHGINVPRTRFLPVKSTSDLFLVASNLYSLIHGELIINSKRMFNNVPLIKLGEDFTGDVAFGNNVELRGAVIIVANHGERIGIPCGSILENKVVSVFF
ncbi:hypothetical protein HPULCUR_006962 [Helicostylum pulchrum]|uniref:UTP--glucose-1-phosphate uridylyltransferase n=1 Tax=Helicostylum pulchrum TaxID=562976 RepID=A0ABP9Y3C2_9FUNG